MPATSYQSSDGSNLEPKVAQLPNAPDYSRPRDNTALEERAREIGAALGQAVATFRSTRARLKDTASHTADAAASHIAEARQQIKSGYANAKTGARKALHDYPVHVAACAGALGLVLGVGLRLWRSRQ